VAIVLNESSKDAVNAQIDLVSCGKVGAIQGYSYTGSRRGFVAATPAGPGAGGKLSQVLPPYSITVLDLGLTDASPVAK
jgi:hypothetical protein